MPSENSSRTLCDKNLYQCECGGGSTQAKPSALCIYYVDFFSGKSCLDCYRGQPRRAQITDVCYGNLQTWLVGIYFEGNRLALDLHLPAGCLVPRIPRSRTLPIFIWEQERSEGRSLRLEKLRAVALALVATGLSVSKFQNIFGVACFRPFATIPTNCIGLLVVTLQQMPDKQQIFIRRVHKAPINIK